MAQPSHRVVGALAQHEEVVAHARRLALHQPETALELVGTRNAVMLGDTLHTDIAGARGVGIASAIVLTGVTTEGQVAAAGAHAPTYLLNGLPW
jgi:ribonucleotide monophosphatase NagD (HAD superfamily)